MNTKPDTTKKASAPETRKMGEGNAPRIDRDMASALRQKTPLSNLAHERDYYKERYNEKLMEAEKWLLERNEAIAQRDELLAASKEAVKWLQKANNSGIFDNCVLPLGGQRAEDSLRSAIAKAEGRIS
jgi:hypothetical protein